MYLKKINAIEKIEGIINSCLKKPDTRDDFHLKCENFIKSILSLTVMYSPILKRLSLNTKPWKTLTLINHNSQ